MLRTKIHIYPTRFPLPHLFNSSKNTSLIYIDNLSFSFQYCSVPSSWKTSWRSLSLSRDSSVPHFLVSLNDFVLIFSPSLLMFFLISY